ncbi:TadE/TadG family type IV pilus assembly protein [Candidatus Riflebacteria bacterium]
MYKLPISNTYSPDSNRKGAILIITSFALVVILGLMTMVFDIGRVYKREAQLRKSLNNSALGAAVVLARTNDVERCQSEAIKIAKANGIKLLTEDIFINKNGNNPDYIYILKKMIVPIHFGKVFKVSRMGIRHSVHTFAQLNNEAVLFNEFSKPKELNYNPLMPSAVLPLALVHGRFLEFKMGKIGQENLLFTQKDEENFKSGDIILLKSGFTTNSGPETGNRNYGLLNFKGSQKTSTERLHNYFRFGYTRRLKVGDIIDLLPGNHHSLVNKTMSHRINGDKKSYFSNMDENNLKPASSRVVVVPIISLYPESEKIPFPDGKQTVMIIGFAKIFLISTESESKEYIPFQMEKFGGGSICARFISYLGSPPTGQEAAKGTIGNLTLF